MLSMKGLIKNVYARESWIDKATGETRPPRFYAQFEQADPTTGRVQFVDVKVNDLDEANACLEKNSLIQVQANAWVNSQTGNAQVSFSQIRDTKIKVATPSAK